MDTEDGTCSPLRLVYHFAMLIPTLSLALMQTKYAAPESGASLYEACRAALRIQVKPDQLSTSDLEGGLQCTSYIAGFVDASSSDPTLCLRIEAHLNVFVGIYVAYMEAHPKEMNESRAVGVYDTLKANYPCPVQK